MTTEEVKELKAESLARWEALEKIVKMIEDLETEFPDSGEWILEKLNEE